MDIIEEKFKQGLKAFRQRENLSQKAAAEKVGLGVSRYAQFESGGAIPPPEVALKLANLCGMDPVKISFWALQKRVEIPPYQELYLQENARFTPQVMQSLREARNMVSLAGVSCFRVIRHCFEAFKQLLASGGDLRVALSNPTTEAFKERRRYESDGDSECLSEEGLVTLRLDFEIRASIELLKGLWSASVAGAWRGGVKVRLYRDLPRASVIITDRTMACMYEYRKFHEGERKPVRICWDPTDERFRKIEDVFEEIWKSGKKNIELNQFAPASYTLPLFPVNEIMSKKTQKIRK